jgi:uncharacterized membrane protein YdjX (TVP38/TMEM64 family)
MFLAFGKISLDRFFGTKIILKLLPKKILLPYDYLLSEESLNGFFNIFLLPYFPDDALCFIAGITRKKF